MNVLEAAVLGVVQGLTEFLPVSSSGHLVLGQAVLGVRAEGVLLEAVVHIATVFAVCIRYRSSLAGLAAGLAAGGGRRRESLRYVALLAAASVPAGVVGLLFRDSVKSAFESPALTSAMLMVTGAFLISTMFASRGPGRAAGPVSAVVVGCFQAAALVPGISRSGSTIGAGLWMGVDGAKAAEFSFLLSIPAVTGACLLEVLDSGSAQADAVPLAAAFAAALVSGCSSLALIGWVMRKQRLHWFGPYCIAAGALGLAFSL